MRVISQDKMHDVPYEGTTFSVEESHHWDDSEESTSWIIRAKCGFYDLKMAQLVTKEECILSLQYLRTCHMDGETYYQMP